VFLRKRRIKMKKDEPPGRRWEFRLCLQKKKKKNKRGDTTGKHLQNTGGIQNQHRVSEAGTRKGQRPPQRCPLQKEQNHYKPSLGSRQMGNFKGILQALLSKRTRNRVKGGGLSDSREISKPV